MYPRWTFVKICSVGIPVMVRIRRKVGAAVCLSISMGPQPLSAFLLQDHVYGEQDRRDADCQ